MQLTIELPSAEEQQAFNKKRWAELCADQFLANLPYRIETNAFGEILISPPSANRHSLLVFAIANLLNELLPQGRAHPEGAISTADGVRAADVVWLSEDRRREPETCDIYPKAPEICVEVVSPSNSDAEIRHKKNLYFAMGALEVWTCDMDGQMKFYQQNAPLEKAVDSILCPHFPKVIKL